MKGSSSHPPRPPPTYREVVRIIVQGDTHAFTNVKYLVEAHEGHRNPRIKPTTHDALTISFLDPPGIEPEFVEQLRHEIQQQPGIKKVMIENRRGQ